MTKRVLIVDDDRQMVRTLSDILRLHGWDAHGTHSGEEAIEAVEHAEFDVVLMDVRMEGVNGVEAFRAMKRIRPGIRVVLMTAYTAGELIAEAEREGALRVLAKPVVLPALVEMLEQAVTGERQVLVVDDDPNYLRTLSDVLRHNGYRVLEADSLQVALDRLEEDSPGVVVLDLRLDGITPAETVLAIKRVSPAVALILYSGHAQTLESLVAELPQPWIHGALQKPFPPERLLELLNTLFA